MGTLITYRPGDAGPGSIAKLVWTSSQSLLEAAAQGRREAAGRLGMWLLNTRQDETCSPALARTIDHALEAARRRLDAAPEAEAQPCAVVPLRRLRFEPIQPDDGEVA